VFAVLAVIGIIYGATIALVQKDLKFVVGYSSVSHMGFVLLGLMTLNQIGLSGAVYQMFSHGIIAGLLFAVVGRMVYDRTHTRDLGELSHMPLARLLPFAAVTFVLAFMASVGLPGFSGFIAELQVLLGSWRAFPWLAYLAGVGILIGIAFSWRALQATFFGDAAENTEHALPPITLPERVGAFVLLASTIVLGLYPRLLMDLIAGSLSGPLFEQLRQGAWR
jgi:NADH-quinone oxidoreductase subunit M